MLSRAAVNRQTCPYHSLKSLGQRVVKLLVREQVVVQHVRTQVLDEPVRTTRREAAVDHVGHLRSNL
jgi:hypothetical protein